MGNLWRRLASGLKKPRVTRAEALAMARPEIRPALDDAPFTVSVNWEWGCWVVRGRHPGHKDADCVVAIDGQTGDIVLRGGGRRMDLPDDATAD